MNRVPRKPRRWGLDPALEHVRWCLGEVCALDRDLPAAFHRVKCDSSASVRSASLESGGGKLEDNGAKSSSVERSALAACEHGSRPDQVISDSVRFLNALALLGPKVLTLRLLAEDAAK